MLKLDDNSGLRNVKETPCGHKVGDSAKTVKDKIFRITNQETEAFPPGVKLKFVYFQEVSNLYCFEVMDKRYPNHLKYGTYAMKSDMFTWT